MTTTLSEGVKVPDVGSTDWADDLETNWNLLNTALAQQGSWAKVDEAQTFTGVQTFSDGIVGSLQGTANMAMSDADGNTITSTYATKTELSTLSDTVGTKANDSDVVHKTGAETIAGAKTFSDTLTGANIVPSANNTYSLGSASYQYNAVYGKNYYYNGVQWGLDQANTWTGDNTFASINSIPTDTVEWHNSHYRGVNLISDEHFADMASLLTAIRNQDWSDIYIGDYVELTFTYESASRTVKFYVGEIDKFHKVGNTSLETHHLVMITGDLGINQVMNDTNTTAGGYVGSKAHTTILPALYEIINPLFNNAILTHREHLSNTVISTQSVSLTLNDTAYTCSNFPIFSSGDPNATGIVTAGAWYDCNLVLMSEIEMFGSNRFSSSGIDDIMCPDGQIAVFKYSRDLLTLGRTVNTWLRNVNSASGFCNCLYYGASFRTHAATTRVRLRPRFLIG